MFLLTWKGSVNTSTEPYSETGYPITNFWRSARSATATFIVEQFEQASVAHYMYFTYLTWFQVLKRLAASAVEVVVVTIVISSYPTSCNTTYH